MNLNFNLLREKEMSKVFSLTENLEKGDVIVFTANGSINRNDELIMGSGIAARVKQRFVTVNGEEISLVFGKLVGHFGNRPFIVPCIDKKTDRRVLVASLPVKPETTPRSRVKKEELLPKYRDDLKREPFIQGWKFRVKPEILRKNLEILVKELNSLVLEGKVLIPLVDCKKSELDEGEILEIYDEYLSKLRYKAVLFTKEGIVKEYEGGAPLSREEKLLLSLKGATGSLTIRLKTEEKLPLSLVDGVMTKSSLSSPEYVLDWVVHRYDLLGGEFQGEKGERFVISPEEKPLYQGLSDKIGRGESLNSILIVKGEKEYYHGVFKVSFYPVERAKEVGEKLFAIRLAKEYARKEGINFTAESNYFRTAYLESKKFLNMLRLKNSLLKKGIDAVVVDVSYSTNEEVFKAIGKGSYFLLKEDKLLPSKDLNQDFDFFLFLNGNRIKGLRKDEFDLRIAPLLEEKREKEQDASPVSLFDK